MSGVSEIRLYQNTTNNIPVASYTTVTSDFIGTATNSIEPGVSYDYDNGLKSVTGLKPGTTYWFWVEIIDGDGNSSGIQPLGSHTTNDVVEIDGSLATVTSTNPTFSPDFSASYIFDGQYGWVDDVYASPDSNPVTITFTLSTPKRIVGFRLYSARNISTGLPHSFPGLVSFSRGGAVLGSKVLQASDFQVGTTNPGAASLRNDYFDLFFENTQSATEYSIFCTWLSTNASTVISIVELVLYEPYRIVPALTAASDQGYIVTESSLLDENYAGWYAFSRAGGFYKGGWSAAADTDPPQYIAIQMPAAATANTVRIWVTQGYDTWKVLGCNIEGSNDGTNWTVLSTFTNMMYTTVPAADKPTNTLYQADFDSDRRAGDDSYVFQGTITNPGSYSHYRLYVTQQENSRAFVDEIVFL